MQREKLIFCMLCFILILGGCIVIGGYTMNVNSINTVELPGEK